MTTSDPLTTWAAIPSNHTFWTAEVVVLAVIAAIVVGFGIRSILKRRNAKLRRAAGAAYFDKDVAQMGLGPAGFGGVAAASNATSDPLAPSFGAPGSRLERSSAQPGPPPAFDAAPPPATFRNGTPDLNDAPSSTGGPEVAGGLPAFAPGDRTPFFHEGAPAPPGAPPPPSPQDMAAWSGRPGPPPSQGPGPTPPPPGSPAGWLPDPGGDPSLIRYWNGASWTEHVARRSG